MRESENVGASAREGVKRMRWDVVRCKYRLWKGAGREVGSRSGSGYFSPRAPLCSLTSFHPCTPRSLDVDAGTSSKAFVEDWD